MSSILFNQNLLDFWYNYEPIFTEISNNYIHYKLPIFNNNFQLIKYNCGYNYLFENINTNNNFIINKNSSLYGFNFNESNIRYWNKMNGHYTPLHYNHSNLEILEGLYKNSFLNTLKIHSKLTQQDYTLLNYNDKKKQSILKNNIFEKNIQKYKPYNTINEDEILIENQPFLLRKIITIIWYFQELYHKSIYSFYQNYSILSNTQLFKYLFTNILETYISLYIYSYFNEYICLGANWGNSQNIINNRIFHKPYYLGALELENPTQIKYYILKYFKFISNNKYMMSTTPQYLIKLYKFYYSFSYTIWLWTFKYDFYVHSLITLPIKIGMVLFQHILFYFLDPIKYYQIYFYNNNYFYFNFKYIIYHIFYLLLFFIEIVWIFIFYLSIDIFNFITFNFFSNSENNIATIFNKSWFFTPNLLLHSTNIQEYNIEYLLFLKKCWENNIFLVDNGINYYYNNFKQNRNWTIIKKKEFLKLYYYMYSSSILENCSESDYYKLDKFLLNGINNTPSPLINFFSNKPNYQFQPIKFISISSLYIPNYYHWNWQTYELSKNNYYIKFYNNYLNYFQTIPYSNFDELRLILKKLYYLEFLTSNQSQVLSTTKLTNSNPFFYTKLSNNTGTPITINIPNNKIILNHYKYWNNLSNKKLLFNNTLYNFFIKIQPFQYTHISLLNKTSLNNDSIFFKLLYNWLNTNLFSTSLNIHNYSIKSKYISLLFSKNNLSNIFDIWFINNSKVFQSNYNPELFYINSFQEFKYHLNLLSPLRPNFNIYFPFKVDVTTNNNQQNSEFYYIKNINKKFIKISPIMGLTNIKINIIPWNTYEGYKRYHLHAGDNNFIYELTPQQKTNLADFHLLKIKYKIKPNPTKNIHSGLFDHYKQQYYSNNYIRGVYFLNSFDFFKKTFLYNNYNKHITDFSIFDEHPLNSFIFNNISNGITNNLYKTYFIYSNKTTNFWSYILTKTNQKLYYYNPLLVNNLFTKYENTDLIKIRAKITTNKYHKINNNITSINNYTLLASDLFNDIFYNYNILSTYNYNILPFNWNILNNINFITWVEKPNFVFKYDLNLYKTITIKPQILLTKFNFSIIPFLTTSSGYSLRYLYKFKYSLNNNTPLYSLLELLKFNNTLIPNILVEQWNEDIKKLYLDLLSDEIITDTGESFSFWWWLLMPFKVGSEYIWETKSLQLFTDYYNITFTDNTTELEKDFYNGCIIQINPQDFSIKSNKNPFWLNFYNYFFLTLNNNNYIYNFYPIKYNTSTNLEINYYNFLKFIDNDYFDNKSSSTIFSKFFLLKGLKYFEPYHTNKLFNNQYLYNTHFNSALEIPIGARRYYYKNPLNIVIELNWLSIVYNFFSMCKALVIGQNYTDFYSQLINEFYIANIGGIYYYNYLYNYNHIINPIHNVRQYLETKNFNPYNTEDWFIKTHFFEKPFSNMLYGVFFNKLNWWKYYHNYYYYYNLNDERSLFNYYLPTPTLNIIDIDNQDNILLSLSDTIIFNKKLKLLKEREFIEKYNLPYNHKLWLNMFYDNKIDKDNYDYYIDYKHQLWAYYHLFKQWLINYNLSKNNDWYNIYDPYDPRYFVYKDLKYYAHTTSQDLLSDYFYNTPWDYKEIRYWGEMGRVDIGPGGDDFRHRISYFAVDDTERIKRLQEENKIKVRRGEKLHDAPLAKITVHEWPHRNLDFEVLELFGGKFSNLGYYYNQDGGFMSLKNEDQKQVYTDIYKKLKTMSTYQNTTIQLIKLLNDNQHIYLDNYTQDNVNSWSYYYKYITNKRAENLLNILNIFNYIRDVKSNWKVNNLNDYKNNNYYRMYNSQFDRNYSKYQLEDYYIKNLYNKHINFFNTYNKTKKLTSPKNNNLWVFRKPYMDIRIEKGLPLRGIPYGYYFFWDELKTVYSPNDHFRVHDFLHLSQRNADLLKNYFKVNQDIILHQEVPGFLTTTPAIFDYVNSHSLRYYNFRTVSPLTQIDLYAWKSERWVPYFGGSLPSMWFYISLLLPIPLGFSFSPEHSIWEYELGWDNGLTNTTEYNDPDFYNLFYPEVGSPAGYYSSEAVAGTYALTGAHNWYSMFSEDIFRNYFFFSWRFKSYLAGLLDFRDKKFLKSTMITNLDLSELDFYTYKKNFNYRNPEVLYQQKQQKKIPLKEIIYDFSDKTFISIEKDVDLLNYNIITNNNKPYENFLYKKSLIDKLFLDKTKLDSSELELYYNLKHAFLKSILLVRLSSFFSDHYLENLWDSFLQAVLYKLYLIDDYNKISTINTQNEQIQNQLLNKTLFYNKNLNLKNNNDLLDLFNYLDLEQANIHTINSRWFYYKINKLKTIYIINKWIYMVFYEVFILYKNLILIELENINVEFISDNNYQHKLYLFNFYNSMKNNYFFPLTHFGFYLNTLYYYYEAILFDMKILKITWSTKTLLSLYVNIIKYFIIIIVNNIIFFINLTLNIYTKIILYFNLNFFKIWYFNHYIFNFNNKIIDINNKKHLYKTLTKIQILNTYKKQLLKDLMELKLAKQTTQSITLIDYYHYYRLPFLSWRIKQLRTVPNDWTSNDFFNKISKKLINFQNNSNTDSLWDLYLDSTLKTNNVSLRYKNYLNQMTYDWYITFSKKYFVNIPSIYFKHSLYDKTLSTLENIEKGYIDRQYYYYSDRPTTIGVEYQTWMCQNYLEKFGTLGGKNFIFNDYYRFDETESNEFSSRIRINLLLASSINEKLNGVGLYDDLEFQYDYKVLLQRYKNSFNYAPGFITTNQHNYNYSLDIKTNKQEEIELNLLKNSLDINLNRVDDGYNLKYNKLSSYIFFENPNKETHYNYSGYYPEHPTDGNLDWIQDYFPTFWGDYWPFNKKWLELNKQVKDWDIIVNRFTIFSIDATTLITNEINKLNKEITINIYNSGVGANILTPYKKFSKFIELSNRTQSKWNLIYNQLYPKDFRFNYIFTNNNPVLEYSKDLVRQELVQEIRGGKFFHQISFYPISTDYLYNYFNFILFPGTGSQELVSNLIEYELKKIINNNIDIYLDTPYGGYFVTKPNIIDGRLYYLLPPTTIELMGTLLDDSYDSYTLTKTSLPNNSPGIHKYIESHLQELIKRELYLLKAQEILERELVEQTLIFKQLTPNYYFLVEKFLPTQLKLYFLTIMKIIQSDYFYYMFMGYLGNFIYLIFLIISIYIKLKVYDYYSIYFNLKFFLVIFLTFLLTAFLLFYCLTNIFSIFKIKYLNIFNLFFIDRRWLDRNIFYIKHLINFYFYNYTKKKTLIYDKEFSKDTIDWDYLQKVSFSSFKNKQNYIKRKFKQPAKFENRYKKVYNYKLFERRYDIKNLFLKDPINKQRTPEELEYEFQRLKAQTYDEDEYKEEEKLYKIKQQNISWIKNQLKLGNKEYLKYIKNTDNFYFKKKFRYKDLKVNRFESTLLTADIKYLQYNKETLEFLKFRNRLYNKNIYNKLVKEKLHNIDALNEFWGRFVLNLTDNNIEKKKFNYPNMYFYKYITILYNSTTNNYNLNNDINYNHLYATQFTPLGLNTPYTKFGMKKWYNYKKGPNYPFFVYDYFISYLLKLLLNNNNIRKIIFKFKNKIIYKNKGNTYNYKYYRYYKNVYILYKQLFTNKQQFNLYYNFFQKFSNTPNNTNNGLFNLKKNWYNYIFMGDRKVINLFNTNLTKQIKIFKYIDFENKIYNKSKKNLFNLTFNLNTNTKDLKNFFLKNKLFSNILNNNNLFLNNLFNFQNADLNIYNEFKVLQYFKNTINYPLMWYIKKFNIYHPLKREKYKQTRLQQIIIINQIMIYLYKYSLHSYWLKKLILMFLLKNFFSDIKIQNTNLFLLDKYNIYDKLDYTYNIFTKYGIKTYFNHKQQYSINKFLMKNISINYFKPDKLFYLRKSEYFNIPKYFLLPINNIQNNILPNKLNLFEFELYKKLIINTIMLEKYKHLIEFISHQWYLYFITTKINLYTKISNNHLNDNSSLLLIKKILYILVDLLKKYKFYINGKKNKINNEILTNKIFKLQYLIKKYYKILEILTKKHKHINISADNTKILQRYNWYWLTLRNCDYLIRRLVKKYHLWVKQQLCYSFNVLPNEKILFYKLISLKTVEFELKIKIIKDYKEQFINHFKLIQIFKNEYNHLSFFTNIVNKPNYINYPQFYNVNNNNLNSNIINIFNNNQKKYFNKVQLQRNKKRYSYYYTATNNTLPTNLLQSSHNNYIKTIQRLKNNKLNYFNIINLNRISGIPLKSIFHDNKIINNFLEQNNLAKNNLISTQFIIFLKYSNDLNSNINYELIKRNKYLIKLYRLKYKSKREAIFYKNKKIINNSIKILNSTTIFNKVAYNKLCLNTIYWNNGIYDEYENLLIDYKSLSIKSNNKITQHLITKYLIKEYLIDLILFNKNIKDKNLTLQNLFIKENKFYLYSSISQKKQYFNREFKKINLFFIKPHITYQSTIKLNILLLSNTFFMKPRHTLITTDIKYYSIWNKFEKPSSVKVYPLIHFIDNTNKSLTNELIC